MPSVTLGKAVAECFWDFAECPWHSTKLLYLIVTQQTRTLGKVDARALGVRRTCDRRWVRRPTVITLPSVC